MKFNQRCLDHDCIYFNPIKLYSIDWNMVFILFRLYKQSITVLGHYHFRPHFDEIMVKYKKYMYSKTHVVI